MARHAEETLSAIGAEAESLVREIFRNLTTASGTRVPIARDDLLTVFEDGEAAERVLGKLIDARLLTSAEGEVEVIHESLLSAWPRLVRWQAQDAEGAVLRDQLRQAARAWQERVRAEDPHDVAGAWCRVNEASSASTFVPEPREELKVDEQAVLGIECGGKAVRLRPSGYGGTIFAAKPRKNWWTRTQGIRTVEAMPFLEAVLLDVTTTPTYQQIAEAARRLRHFGLSHARIGRALRVTDKTVGKATRWCSVGIR